MLNVGVWGPGPTRMDDFVRVNRDLERKLHDLGGNKWLYAHTYYTEQEFWEIYDRKWYESLRERYAAVSLPTVYDKVKVNSSDRRTSVNGLKGSWFYQTFRQMWPVSGLIGVLRATVGGGYLLAK